MFPVTLEVIYFITTALLCLCQPNLSLHWSNWHNPSPTIFTERQGPQMPPHHEPDAVLINVGRRNPPIGYPGFGMPNNPNYPPGPRFPDINNPDVFRPQNLGPGAFGVTREISRFTRNPRTFDVPKKPNYSTTRGEPQIPNDSRVFNPLIQTSGIFENPVPARNILPGKEIFMQGGNDQFQPNTPNVFYISREEPRKVFGEPRAFIRPESQSQLSRHNSIGIANETPLDLARIPISPRVLATTGTHGNPSIYNDAPNRKEIGRPNGSPNVFWAAGNDNFPRTYIPQRLPPTNQSPDYFPVARGIFHEFFLPNSGFFPQTFNPGTSFIPFQPKNFGEIYPTNTFNNRGYKDREMNDDPIMDSFPMIDQSPLHNRS